MYLSNHTVHCRISLISCDILDDVADEIRRNKAQESHFSKMSQPRTPEQR